MLTVKHVTTKTTANIFIFMFNHCIKYGLILLLCVVLSKKRVLSEIYGYFLTDNNEQKAL